MLLVANQHRTLLTQVVPRAFCRCLAECSFFCLQADVSEDGEIADVESHPKRGRSARTGGRCRRVAESRRVTTDVLQGACCAHSPRGWRRIFLLGGCWGFVSGLVLRSFFSAETCC